MSSPYQTCVISRGPVTGKAIALPMAETPYRVAQTEHGPYWLFSLPFRVKDNGNDLVPPASPGDHAVNNTSEEVAEAVVAAVSLRHIQRWIEKTTPPDNVLQQITANDSFTTLRPYRQGFTGDVRNDFDRLVEARSGFHIFNDRASESFAYAVKQELAVIAAFNAPTVETLRSVIASNSSQLPGVLEGIAELIPGAVALKFRITIPAGHEKSSITGRRAALLGSLTAVLTATNTGWEVEQLQEDSSYHRDDDEPTSKFDTIWYTSFKVQLPEVKMGELAAKIAANKLEQLCQINPVFITEHRAHSSMSTDYVLSGFAYATEAAWKAVNNLPVPRECKDWDSYKISESDFVGAAEALSDLIAAGYANGIQKFRQSIPAFFRGDGLHFVDGMLTDLEYLLNTKHYGQDSADPVQRLVNSMESNAKFVFGIDPAPPFYSGVLDILLRTIIDGEGFLEDIAAKSSLTVRECQRIIYRRVYETRCVFDRLDYLRIKPTPSVTEHRSSMCDTDYHAKALRAIATAIRADGASSTKRNYRR